MCECNICQRGRNFQARLAQLPEDQRAYFEALYDTLEHAEMDRDYYHAVIDGSWPTADEVLARSRAQRAAKQSETADLALAAPPSPASPESVAT